MNVLVVVEKPFVAEAVLDSIRRLDPWPGAGIVVVTTILRGFYRFHHPDGSMAVSSLPAVRDPLYRYGVPHPWAEGWRWPVWRRPEGSGGFSLDREASVRLADTDGGEAYLEGLVRGADVVADMTDRGRRGAMAFSGVVTLGDRLPGAASRARVMDGALASLVPAEVDRIVASLGDGTAPPWMPGSPREAEGRLRDFFDYNWALNAGGLLLPPLRQAGLPAAGPPSKFALQLFLHVASSEQPPSESGLLRLMDRWPGSGRYAPPSGGFAGLASRTEILRGLVDLGLLERRQVPGKGPGGTVALTRIQVSPAGERFASGLPRSARDPDLPFRLEAWGRDWPRSRPRVEAWFGRYFGAVRRTVGMVALVPDPDAAGSVRLMLERGLDLDAVAAAAQVSRRVVEAATGEEEISPAQARALALAALRTSSAGGGLRS